MANERILIVEDEEDIRELLEFNLAREGYRVEQAETGEDGYSQISRSLPSLVLLDLMLPGMDGLDVCRKVKQDPRTQHIPVIILSAKGEESDIVVGLELGADDYITKPFSPKILLARIKTVLRRHAVGEETSEIVVRYGSLLVDTKRHQVKVDGVAIELTATEYHVLVFLLRRPGWVFTRKQIVDAVKGEDYAVTERSVDVQMVGLRKKLGTAAEWLETVRGIGYRFKEEDEG